MMLANVETGSTLYLNSNLLTNKLRERTYNLLNIKIKVSREPNDLFIKCSYTNVSHIKELVYVLNNELKKFNIIETLGNGKKIKEIIVYYLRYNDSPLYLVLILDSISQAKITNGTPEEIKKFQENFLTYRLTNEGLWEEGSHHYYVMEELKSQTYNLNMLQFFEIENIPKDYKKIETIPHYYPTDLLETNLHDYKFCRHFMNTEKPITKLFTYRNRILKDIIIVDKKVYKIDVVYNKNDKNNNLPLMIIVYLSEKNYEGKLTEYFVNKGGNYSWKRENSDQYYDDENKLKERLDELNSELMGEKVSIHLDYLLDKYDSLEKYSVNEKITIQKTNLGDIQYDMSKYYHTDNKRFSVIDLKYNSDKDIDEKVQDNLSFYSILSLYAFQHKGQDFPLFLCVVYERKNNEIFHWYKLVDFKNPKYELSYELAGDPRNFKNLWPEVRYLESLLHQVDFKIGSNLASVYHQNIKELKLMNDLDFNIHYEPNETKHNKYVITPTYGIHFSIKSFTIYKESIQGIKFDSVKEVYVFEHQHCRHYKVCIVRIKHNYSTGTDQKDFQWFEFRKNTILSDNWRSLGRLTFKNRDPRDIKHEQINELMDEKKNDYYEEKHKDVSYKRPFDHVPCRNPIEDDSENEDEEKGKPKTLSSMVGGLVGTGAGVGLATVTSGYLIYSNFPTIAAYFATIFR